MVKCYWDNIDKQISLRSRAQRWKRKKWRSLGAGEFLSIPAQRASSESSLSSLTCPDMAGVPMNASWYTARRVNETSRIDVFSLCPTMTENVLHQHQCPKHVLKIGKRTLFPSLPCGLVLLCGMRSHYHGLETDFFFPITFDWHRIRVVFWDWIYVCALYLVTWLLDPGSSSVPELSRLQDTRHL